MAAGWTVWRPVETFPSTAVLIAAVVLGLTVWGWRRTPASSAYVWPIAAAVLCVLGASGLTGWDPASAITQLALLATAAMLTWLASRSATPDRLPASLALVISGLALWGLWQVFGGMERAATVVVELPDELRAAAAERLASGRAFASQLLPSHLAVVFATALPLLLARVRPDWRATPWIMGVVLCTIGLALTRSPIGIGLALAACFGLACGRGRRWVIWVAAILAIVLAAAVGGRGDVMELEPVRLRADNWRTAAWVWTNAPAAGVGIGGFAQAAQAVPFAVGNRPRHAHSLAFEALAELGPVGLLGCALAGLALWRLLRELWPARPELAVALAVIPIHNLVDFSLYGTGVALPWAVLLGWALALRRGDSVLSAPARGRIVLVGAVALALAGTVLHLTSIAVEDAAASREAAVDRLDGALDARRLAPWRVDPLGLVAAAAIDSGDPIDLARASTEMDRAQWLRPRSAALAGLRARLAIAAGEAPTAVAEAWFSETAQPSNIAHAGLYRSVLDLVDTGSRREAP